jgi:hypothetical protein
LLSRHLIALIAATSASDGEVTRAIPMILTAMDNMNMTRQTP